jgi:periplasmic divalent cation tolerance protein
LVVRLISTQCDARGMYSVVLVACPPDHAEKIAARVLEMRLAACVNVVETVHSRYWWKGKIESADESLLLIKTRASLFGRLERAVKQVHPYAVPEVVEMPIRAGRKSYLDWIAKETAPRTKPGGR